MNTKYTHPYSPSCTLFFYCSHWYLPLEKTYFTLLSFSFYIDGHIYGPTGFTLVLQQANNLDKCQIKACPNKSMFPPAEGSLCQCIY
jgi:hypothetical protein